MSLWSQTENSLSLFYSVRFRHYYDNRPLMAAYHDIMSKYNIHNHIAVGQNSKIQILICNAAIKLRRSVVLYDDCPNYRVSEALFLPPAQFIAIGLYEALSERAILLICHQEGNRVCKQLLRISIFCLDLFDSNCAKSWRTGLFFLLELVQLLRCSDHEGPHSCTFEGGIVALHWRQFSQGV